MLKNILVLGTTGSKNMDVMIDIETFGLSPKGVIASIGAVSFGYGELPMLQIFDSFYTNLRTDNQGRMLTPSTIEWWLQQSKEAQEALLEQPKVAIDSALKSLASFLRKADRIWANGVSFDLAILRDAYEQCGQSVPWGYGQEMCMRSIRVLGKELGLDYSTYKNTSGIVQHNALADATLQAKYVIGVFETAKGNTLDKNI